MPPALGKRGRPEDGGGGGGRGRTPGPGPGGDGLPGAGGAAEVAELNRQFLAWAEARVRGPGAAPGAPLGAGCRAYLRHLAALQQQPSAVRPPTEPEIPARGGAGSGGWRARTPTRSSAPSRGPPNAGPSETRRNRHRAADDDGRAPPRLPDGPVGPSTCSGGARADSARLRFAASDRPPTDGASAGPRAGGWGRRGGDGVRGRVRGHGAGAFDPAPTRRRDSRLHGLTALRFHLRLQRWFTHAQLGLGEDVPEAALPRPLPALGRRVVQVCCGGMHTLALTRDGASIPKPIAPARD